MKTSDATIGSKHNAGIATAISARFEIHFIYPASGVMLCCLLFSHLVLVRLVVFALSRYFGYTCLHVFGSCFFPWDLGRVTRRFLGLHIFGWCIFFLGTSVGFFFHLAGSCVFFNSQLSHFLHVKFLAVFYFGLMRLFMEGFLSEGYLCEFQRRARVAVCARGYLCESQRKEIGLLCAPRDICVNPREKRSGCCVRPGISA